jgi:hypothetical protein
METGHIESIPRFRLGEPASLGGRSLSWAALEWRDLDRRDEVVTIRRTYTRGRLKETTKTEAFPSPRSASPPCAPRARSAPEADRLGTRLP